MRAGDREGLGMHVLIKFNNSLRSESVRGGIIPPLVPLKAMDGQSIGSKVAAAVTHTSDSQLKEYALLLIIILL